MTGLDGWEAVRLWHRWCAGDEAARDLLLRYNEADTRNLEPLASLIYDRMVARFGPSSLGILPTHRREPNEVAP